MISDTTPDLLRAFEAVPGDFSGWSPTYNAAPTDTVPAFLVSARGEDEPVRRLEPARWSLVPSYAREMKLKYPTSNARSEGLAEKATWRGPLKSHRAIIPANGWYEWTTDPDGRKRPHFIHLPGNELMGLAGLYSWWPNHALPEEHEDFWTLTVTMLTSDSVDQILELHDRSAVPLPRDLWAWWLDPTIAGDQTMVDAAVKSALPVAEELEVHEVGRIASSTVDGPGLIEPLRA